MGCAKSTPKGEASVNPPRDALEILTDGQKDLLRTSWEAFRTEYMLTDGIQIYIHLFTVDPSAATLFSFVEEVSIEHLLTNEQLFGHVWSLLEYLDMAITHLDDLHYLRREAFDLGVRHSIYGVRNEQFQAVVGGILFALGRKLGASFTAETKDAWSTLLKFFTEIMAEGNTDAQERPQSCKESSADLEAQGHAHFYYV